MDLKCLIGYNISGNSHLWLINGTLFTIVRTNILFLQYSITLLVEDRYTWKAVLGFFFRRPPPPPVWKKKWLIIKGITEARLKRALLGSQCPPLKISGSATGFWYLKHIWQELISYKTTFFVPKTTSQDCSFRFNFTCAIHTYRFLFV